MATLNIQILTRRIKLSALSVRNKKVGKTDTGCKLTTKCKNKNSSQNEYAHTCRMHMLVFHNILLLNNYVKIMFVSCDAHGTSYSLCLCQSRVYPASYGWPKGVYGWLYISFTYFCNRILTVEYLWSFFVVITLSFRIYFWDDKSKIRSVNFRGELCFS